MYPSSSGLLLVFYLNKYYHNTFLCTNSTLKLLIYILTEKKYYIFKTGMNSNPSKFVSFIWGIEAGKLSKYRFYLKRKNDSKVSQD